MSVPMNCAYCGSDRSYGGQTGTTHLNRYGWYQYRCGRKYHKERANWSFPTDRCSHRCHMNTVEGLLVEIQKNPDKLAELLDAALVEIRKGM
jgi:hypothetical protein